MLPPLYPITPSGLLGPALMSWASELLEAGCRFLQYRRKAGPDRDRLRELEELLALCRAYGCTLVVDDRLDLVLLSGAEGLHLGQSDLPPREARQILGPAKIIGLSTHNLEQFEEACEEPADYLALGPVFPTSSKASADPPVPVAIQREILRRSPLPVVAIGGITPGNARELWARGFTSLAVIGALAVNPGKAWEAFMRERP